jgi:hypothetical protein
VVGTVLGAMKASGREHLTVSLLMIGECCCCCYIRVTLGYILGTQVLAGNWLRVVQQRCCNLCPRPYPSYGLVYLTLSSEVTWKWP